MPIVHKYRVKCIKNNECIILVQSVIKNRNLYLNPATMFVHTVTLLYSDVMQSKSHRAIKGIQIMFSVNIKHNACIFNIISMLPSLNYSDQPYRKVGLNTCTHTLLYQNLKSSIQTFLNSVCTILRNSKGIIQLLENLSF